MLSSPVASSLIWGRGLSESEAPPHQIDALSLLATLAQGEALLSEPLFGSSPRSPDDLIDKPVPSASFARVKRAKSSPALSTPITLPRPGSGTNRYRCVSQNGRKWKARVPGNSPKGWIAYIGTFDEEEEAAYAVARSEAMLAEGVAVEEIVAQLRPVPDKRLQKHEDVSWHRQKRQWQAKAMVEGQSECFGFFSEQDEASLASCFAKDQLAQGASSVHIRNLIKEGRHWMASA